MVVSNVRKIKNQEYHMTETFHMTSSMRIGSAMLTALLRAGLPLGSLTLLSVRGRKSGKISTTPVALVEQDGTRFLVAAFGEVSWVRNLRTAGSAQLTRGRRTEVISVVELEAREAAPILKQFLTSYHMVPLLPPYFDVTSQSPLANFEREATRHPVFRLVRANRT
jgi:deazaflavin-dependent oxidoreductase (nitroreductase family)